MKCCDMHAGKLRTPVVFERGVKTSDGAGGHTIVWDALADSAQWAFVKALSGSERHASERVEAMTKWRIVVRYFSGLKESDRVVMRGENFNIRFIDNVELRDQWLRIDLAGGVA